MSPFRLAALISAFVAFPLIASAQVSGNANVVSSCGTVNGGAYQAAQTRAITQDTNGKQCINGTFSAQSTPLPVTPTDRGGTIGTGGTSQVAIAANASRQGCLIQNPLNASEDLFVSSTASAVTTPGAPDDADLGPGMSWSCTQGGTVIQTDIRVNAATTSHAYMAKETQ